MERNGKTELVLVIPGDETPETVDSTFLFRLGSAYLQLLERIALEQGQTLAFTGLNLRPGSTIAAVLPSDADIAQDCADEGAAYVSGDSEAPPGVEGHARDVSNLLRRAGRIANVIIGPWHRPLTPRSQPEPGLRTEVVSLRADVLRVGAARPGAQPSLRLQCVSEPFPFSLKIPATMAADVPKLGAQLTREIDIVATVRRDDEGKVVGGTLDEWFPLEEGSGVEAWRDWFRRSCPEWDQVEDVANALGRTEEDGSSDDRH